MKTHVVVIVFLFSFSGLAAVAQTSQKAVGRSVETPTPTPAASAQQTVSPELEKSLADLTTAVTKLVDRQSKAEGSSLGGVLDIPIKVVGGLVSVIGCLVGLFGFSRDTKAKKEANEDMKEAKQAKKESQEEFKKTIAFIRAFLVGVAILVGLCLVSGLITAALYVLFGFMMLIVASLIAAAHLLTFIDHNEELKRRMRKHFPELFGNGLPSESPSASDSP